MSLSDTQYIIFFKQSTISTCHIHKWLTHGNKNMTKSQKRSEIKLWTHWYFRPENSTFCGITYTNIIQNNLCPGTKRK